MATQTEIRQKLVQGGMSVDNAQKAAGILADMPAFAQPAGTLWDTLTAKGYRMISRPIATVFRFITNDKINGIVVTKDGLNSVYVESDVSKL